MSKVICEREDIVAIADAVRNKTGTTDELTLGGIVSGINGISESSGGASIETCTLTLDSENFSTYYFTDVYCSIVDQNKITPCSMTPLTEKTVLSIPLNTLVRVRGFSNTHTKITGNCSMTDIAADFFALGDVTVMAKAPCFVRGTLITLSDYTQKPVQDITYGDELLVWDFDNGCFSSSTPLWIKKTQTTDNYYLCKFANGIELKLVGSNGKCHRLFNVESGMFESATDCIGKRIMTEQGETILLSCENIHEEVEFYNIITHTHMNLYAENILTSCRFNNIYPIKNMKFVKDDRKLRSIDDYKNIDATMFDGLRLAEQDMDINEINAYIQRLYNLKAK